MARCGCGSSAVCTCVVTAGDNITVSGSGNVGSPYVVSAVLTPVTTLDTATVDLSTGVNPLTANVKLDPPAGNLIIATANGLRVDCTDVQGCFDNGNGIGPIVGGLIQACLSTDPGNSITFGADGCLFVPAGAFSGLTGVGCGLTGLGTAISPLATNTPVAWPFVCADTNGAPVYCGADGQLRTNPAVDAITNIVQVNNTVNIPLLAPGNPFQLLDNVVSNITNPSACVTAAVMSTFDVDVDFDIPVASSVELQFAADVYWQFDNRGTATLTDIHWQFSRTAFNILAPGASLPAGVATVPIEARQNAGAGAVATRVQWRARHLLITLQA